MERRVQEIELPGGQTVLARVSVLQPEEVPGGPDDFGYEDVGALDHLSACIDQLNELVGGVGSAVLEAARAVRPDEVSATFGVELAVKPGKAVALLADGEAKAAISVTLTWHTAGASADASGDGAAGPAPNPLATPANGDSGAA
ncbi:CU044_2847 family protein [Streptomyces venetus]|uniref:CU044_2847 family protein n=1 Tax=Streptomyces venetus TaxID=1701086 RepID=UPI003C2C069B